MSNTLDTCRLCPRLCRHACPVATASGREAAVPTLIADVVQGWKEGRVDRDLAVEAVTLCVDCGRCQDACHLHQPLPTLLAEARRTLLGPRDPAPLGEIAGEGELVAVESGGVAWGAALALETGRSVGVWVTSDALGSGCDASPDWADHLNRIVVKLAGRLAVTADGAVARVLERSGTRWAWLGDVVPEIGVLVPSCAGGSGRCCGGGEPLRSSHPELAAQLAARWVRDGSGSVADQRCGSHLRACGYAVEDAVTGLLSLAGSAP